MNELKNEDLNKVILELSEAMKKCPPESIYRQELKKMIDEVLKMDRLRNGGGLA